MRSSWAEDVIVDTAIGSVIFSRLAPELEKPAGRQMQKDLLVLWQVLFDCCLLGGYVLP